MIVGESFIRSKSLLPQKEREFLHWYAKLAHKKEAAIRAGYKTSMALKEANRILTKPNAKSFLSSVIKTAERKVGWEFESKLKKLKQVADLAIPDDAKTMDELTPTAGISAIAEANKMQGHYSAEKIVQTNINVDADLQQVHELLEKYKREY